ncbi:hypothetical protein AAHA92_01362 [Salvia divinorum]|uniref:Reverse transcriptase zinc-binding domain-containing protein n=1 Tax=Salvia divinorum TaxID=28513 RepID=A0ABD1IMM8_SALDI
MEEFSACSGLEVNQGKSNIFIAGNIRVPKEELVEVFGFPEGTLPIKYLGIPLASKRLNASDYGQDEMLEKGSREDAISLWRKWFSSKGTQEAYDWFRPREERRFWAKYVWKDFVPPKYSFTTWLAIRGRLSTKDRLVFVDDLDTTCQLCGRQDESVDHLFFKCPKTWGVWGKILEWLGIARRSVTIKSVIKWAGRQSRGSVIVQTAKRIALMAAVSLIWKMRNAVIFDGKTWDTTRVIFQIKEATYSILYSRYSPDQVVLHLPDR